MQMKAVKLPNGKFHLYENVGGKEIRRTTTPVSKRELLMMSAACPIGDAPEEKELKVKTYTSRIILPIILLFLVFMPSSRLMAQVTTVSANAPAWIMNIPEGELFSYFRGDAVDSNLKAAKLKARSEALQWAQMHGAMGTTDVLVDKTSLTTDNNKTVEDASTEASVAFGATKIVGLEWVADYSEAVPSGTSSGFGYHYWVLIRIPKAKTTGLAARIGGGITGRADAVFHSAIYPGWGQIRQGRTGSGAFFAFTGTLTGMAIGAFYALEHTKQTAGKTDWKQYRKGATYAFGGLYALNLVDALIAGHHYSEYRALTVSPTHITYHFRK